jgi:hypothetical protein
MPTTRLDLTRAQILTYRRAVQALDRRLPPGAVSLRRAAWAGLQDSMPRAALLSLHARVNGTTADTWTSASLAQLWGPRYSAYVVAARDTAIFSLARLPEAGAKRRLAEHLAARLRPLLAAGPMPYGLAGRALGVPPNQLRYAALTGTVLMRWDGASAPTIWMVPPPGLSPGEARLELARRYLHVFGPTTEAAFSQWAGLSLAAAAAAFAALRRGLLPVRTPIGAAWMLTRDEPAIRDRTGMVAPARLLPSGDAYFLLQGTDRLLLVEDAAQRRALWTSRVWPGALLVEGAIAGTWRRAEGRVSVTPWRRLSRAAREAVEAEVAALPLPGLMRVPETHWVV